MKINDSVKKTPVVGPAGGQPRAGKADAKPAAGQATQDGVQVSSQLQSISTQAGSGVFDANKVEKIKAAIAGGEFKVDPEKVASGLIDTVKDLIRARKA